MVKAYHLSLDRIQPTQSTVNPSTLDWYNSIDPKLQLIPLPEVWLWQGRFYLADGHNKSYVFYKKGNLIIPVIIHSPENCGLTAAAYEYVLSELIENAEKIKQEKIFHIKDLKLKQ